MSEEFDNNNLIRRWIQIQKPGIVASVLSLSLHGGISLPQTSIKRRFEEPATCCPVTKET